MLRKIFWKIQRIGRNYKNKRRLAMQKKIILGLGDTQYNNWICTDIDILNVAQYSDFAKYWQENSREAFLAEHVWEHLPPEIARKGLENCFAFLKSGGYSGGYGGGYRPMAT